MEVIIKYPFIFCFIFFIFLELFSHVLPSPITTNSIDISTFAFTNITNNTHINDTTIQNYDYLYKGMVCERCNVEYCYFNGGCCKSADFKFCSCLHTYVGEHCEWKNLESVNRRTILTLGASMTTLFVTLLALLLLIFVIFYVIRHGKSHHKNGIVQSEVLDRELVYVQSELDKLSGKDKACDRMRLATMIEATARAALITYPILMEESKIDTQDSFKSLKITRRHSDPAVTIISIDDVFKVQKSTEVFIYNKQGNVKFTKPNLRKLISL